MLILLAFPGRSEAAFSPSSSILRFPNPTRPLDGAFELVETRSVRGSLSWVLGRGVVGASARSGT